MNNLKNSAATEHSASKHLIKHGELISASSTPVLLSLEAWQQTLQDAGGVGEGVSLPGELELFDAGLLTHLGDLKLIAIEFTAFTDGRGFSLAAQLRQYGFKGELRATGAILIDQLHYLQRCGFDAFELSADADTAVALDALAAFSDAYQPGW